jgi:membrane-associated HD superfamily phosphohydrolase
MNEWITKRQLEQFERKYKVEWLNYKRTQDSSMHPAVYDKWLKDKLEEELENDVEMYMKEWMAFKSDQALLGKVINLNDWMNERVKKRRLLGGRSKSIHKQSKHIHKQSKRIQSKRIRKQSKNKKSKRIRKQSKRKLIRK